jgi:hypothetical protein
MDSRRRLVVVTVIENNKGATLGQEFARKIQPETTGEDSLQRQRVVPQLVDSLKLLLAIVPGLVHLSRQAVVNAKGELHRKPHRHADECGEVARRFNGVYYETARAPRWPLLDPRVSLCRAEDGEGRLEERTLDTDVLAEDVERTRGRACGLRCEGNPRDGADRCEVVCPTIQFSHKTGLADSSETSDGKNPEVFGFGIESLDARPDLLELRGAIQEGSSIATRTKARARFFLWPVHLRR